MSGTARPNVHHHLTVRPLRRDRLIRILNFR
jgi:hypothetical protein